MGITASCRGHKGVILCPRAGFILFCKESRMDYIRHVMQEEQEVIGVLKFFGIVGPLALAIVWLYPML
jgi:hypothetical protein